MASASCHVYVVSYFERGMARIFHGGFGVTSAFNLFEQPRIFPTFLFCLYHPIGLPGMDGQDDTIQIPTPTEKLQMYDASCTYPFYNTMYLSVEETTEDSLWIQAVRFHVKNGKRMSEVADCFTIGLVLSCSDGLFGHATCVYRVILKEDKTQEQPPIYAVKILALFASTRLFLTLSSVWTLEGCVAARMSQARNRFLRHDSEVLRTERRKHEREGDDIMSW
ncbi:hypothetical protein MVEN_00422900 [Mycena venus]|uniref:Uncharacterized protein n=1 Tax=Mycena venus TaxID=2733690 RepID=A0A8H7D7U7_9AGAR|nr:hypothetical protein MVEN_00422900 [Mycena venus]